MHYATATAPSASSPSASSSPFRAPPDHQGQQGEARHRDQQRPGLEVLLQERVVKAVQDDGRKAVEDDVTHGAHQESADETVPLLR